LFVSAAVPKGTYRFGVVVSGGDGLLKPAGADETLVPLGEVKFRVKESE